MGVLGSPGEHTVHMSAMRAARAPPMKSEVAPAALEVSLPAW